MIDIDKTDLEDFIGPPVFSSRRIYEETPPGVVTGLAYNSVGGGILFLEATQAGFCRSELDKSGALSPAPVTRGSLRVTGRLGEVMKESSLIAQTFAKQFLYSNLHEKKPEALRFLEEKDIHIHFPEGATPKDGPSAGITITTALVGLALREPCL